jgi:ABC-type sugar transport system substrate-binding protein
MHFRLNSALAAAAIVAALTGAAAAQSGAPIRIGFSIAMTGVHFR